MRIRNEGHTAPLGHCFRTPVGVRVFPFAPSVQSLHLEPTPLLSTVETLRNWRPGLGTQVCLPTSRMPSENLVSIHFRLRSLASFVPFIPAWG